MQGPRLQLHEASRLLPIIHLDVMSRLRWLRWLARDMPSAWHVEACFAFPVRRKPKPKPKPKSKPCSSEFTPQHRPETKAEAAKPLVAAARQASSPELLILLCCPPSPYSVSIDIAHCSDRRHLVTLEAARCRKRNGARDKKAKFWTLSYLAGLWIQASIH